MIGAASYLGRLGGAPGTFNADYVNCANPGFYDLKDFAVNTTSANFATYTSHRSKSFDAGVVRNDGVTIKLYYTPGTG